MSPLCGIFAPKKPKKTNGGDQSPLKAPLWQLANMIKEDSPLQLLGSVAGLTFDGGGRSACVSSIFLSGNSVPLACAAENTQRLCA